MDQKSLLRLYRGYVLLGLPPAPLSYLARFRRRYACRPHVFVRRCPLLLRLLPLAVVHKSAARKRAEILIMELSDLAEENAEKLLTLIPCSPDARRFVRQNRDTLEQSYIIQLTDEPPLGGTK